LQELFADEITVPLHPEPLKLFRVNLLQESSGCLRDSYILPGTGDWIGNFDEISIYQPIANKGELNKDAQCLNSPLGPKRAGEIKTASSLRLCKRNKNLNGSRRSARGAILTPASS
jgi:hypothetical protein